MPGPRPARSPASSPPPGRCWTAIGRAAPAPPPCWRRWRKRMSCCSASSTTRTTITAGSCRCSRRCTPSGPTWSSASRCSRAACSRCWTAGWPANSPSGSSSSSREWGIGLENAGRALPAAVPVRAHQPHPDGGAERRPEAHQGRHGERLGRDPASGAGRRRPARRRASQRLPRLPVRDLWRAPDRPRQGRREGAEGPTAAFGRFVESQTTWDRAMAEALARHVIAGIGGREAAGGGHHGQRPHPLRPRRAAPAARSRREERRDAAARARRLDCKELRPGLADAVFALPERPRRSPSRRAWASGWKRTRAACASSMSQPAAWPKRPD